MRLLFLGAGSGFTLGEDNYQSNMLLIDESRDDRLLIDCGTDARFSLHEQGYSSAAINNLYISHLHADHVGGLEWLGFTSMFGNPPHKPRLFIAKDFEHELWEKTLSGGMSSLSTQIADLNSYFDTVYIENEKFNWSGTIFHLVRTFHVHHGEELRPSFGLFFKVKDKHILISTDTQFKLDMLGKYYEKADLIFHDCETMNTKSGVHAHYEELYTLPEKIRKKMWLYHYNDKKSQHPVQDGFKGFVQKGQSFDLSDEATYK